MIRYKRSESISFLVCRIAPSSRHTKTTPRCDNRNA